MSDVYDAIVAYIEQHDYPPSLRELAETCGVSIGTVHKRLGELEERGWITREPVRGRAIRLNRKGAQ